MTDPLKPRRPRRRAAYAAAAVAAAAVIVAGGFAVQTVSRASRLIWSQRLRVNLRLIDPGAPADLKRLSSMGPHRVTVRRGPRPGERTEIWDYGPAQVDIHFAPGQPTGLIARVEGRSPPMAWPPGRGPQEARGNLRPGSVVPIETAYRPARR